MVDFHSFETFDPNGPGLGNLFGQISPFEALGIWPSGDFRLAPGDGAVPAAGYYLGAAFGTVLLLYGIWQLPAPSRLAILAGLFTCAVAFAAARAGGTPYTTAKAIEIAAPLVALTLLLPLVSRSFGPHRGENVGTLIFSPRAEGRGGLVGGVAAGVFVVAAGVCSLLALANAPVGPPSYSPALTGFRAEIADGLDRLPRLRRAPCRGPRRALRLLGAARRPRLHRRRRRTGRSRRRRSATWSPKALSEDPPFRGLLREAGRQGPTCSGKSWRRRRARAPAR